MKNLSRYLAAIAGALAFLTPATFTQSEKIILKMAPQPNRTVQMGIGQVMEMNMSFEGAAPPGAPIGPMKMLTKTILALTQKTGAPNAQGFITSVVTYDDVMSEATINGQPMQTGYIDRKFKGKRFTVVFDKQGDIADIRIPPGSGLSKEMLGELMKGIYTYLPASPMGVGEVATTPLDFTIPSLAPGAPPIKIAGQINHKLVSIEKDAAGRLAKLDQTFDGKVANDLNISTPNGPARMSFDFKINGAGASVINIDKGLMKSSDSSGTFSGRIKMVGVKTIGFNVHGTAKTTLIGGK